MEFIFAPDIKKQINKISKKLPLIHIKYGQIVCFRSFGSKSRAQARIWSLPQIWQKALKVKAHYCIEVLSERFDKLNYEEQIKVLIHELLHIPKTFSGALLPHRGRGRIRININTVNILYNRLQKTPGYQSGVECQKAITNFSEGKKVIKSKFSAALSKLKKKIPDFKSGEVYKKYFSKGLI